MLQSGISYKQKLVHLSNEVIIINKISSYFIISLRILKYVKEMRFLTVQHTVIGRYRKTRERERECVASNCVVLRDGSNWAHTHTRTSAKCVCACCACARSGVFVASDYRLIL